MSAKRPLAVFWKAVEDLSGAATSQKEWVELLGNEWAPGTTLLRSTGDIAKALACPSTSEDGCLRQVVRLSDGRLRAECGHPYSNCDSIVLNKTDLEVLALDTSKLAKAITGALNLVGRSDTPVLARATYIGRYEIGPGRSFPVFLYLPQPTFGARVDGLDSVATSPPGPRLVLVPTRRSLAFQEVKRLDRLQATTMALEDILVWQSDKGFRPIDDPEKLFQGLIRDLSGIENVKKPTIVVPAGTMWENIKLDLANPHQFNATIFGQSCLVEPHNLNMVKGPLNKPTVQWVLLEQFAYARGRLPLGTHSLKKQKQLLVQKMNTAFGILDDPFVVEQGCYVARFKISADGIEATEARKRRTR